MPALAEVGLHIQIAAEIDKTEPQPPDKA